MLSSRKKPNLSITRFLLTSILPAIALYALILIICTSNGIDTELVLRDLLQTCRYPIGVGMISNIGILLWAAAAAVSLFSCLSGITTQKDWQRFLLVGGIFSTLLCLDDFFLLHDQRQIFQDILYTSYIIIIINILVRFRQLITHSHSLSFIGASIMLGLSLITDIFQDFFPFDYTTAQIIEEGFKFVGIWCWLYFWIKTAIKAVNYSIEDKYKNV